MILKFDHISYIASKSCKKSILQDKGIPSFAEESLINIDSKLALMKNPQSNHDLYFFAENYPVEYIFYDKIERKSSILFDEDIVYAHYCNKEKTIEFFKCIFGDNVCTEEKTLKINMKGVLDKRDYYLVLKEKEEYFETYVDDGGYGVIAIVCNTFDCNFPSDVIYTKGETLNVNNRQLEISFLKSHCVDIIFEIIKIKR